jgi:hypothetical protein
LAVGLARGYPLEKAATFASVVTAQAVEHGLDSIGAGDGPVDVFNLAASR